MYKHDPAKLNPDLVCRRCGVFGGLKLRKRYLFNKKGKLKGQSSQHRYVSCSNCKKGYFVAKGVKV